MLLGRDEQLNASAAITNTYAQFVSSELPVALSSPVKRMMVEHTAEYRVEKRDGLELNRNKENPNEIDHRKYHHARIARCMHCTKRLRLPRSRGLWGPRRVLQRRDLLLLGTVP